ncbi:MAG: LysR family transcriptional regulator [Acidimicrobiales bacterium]|jgi:LysR family hydrogen peroxide-inducible transcriptional activator|nr:LysR family transcriptional regulator [Acidimicrobiales bacterium]MDP6298698.1 LysR family transcriptional regulator [Acidimicrobiales bacterium]HJM27835.1 LysR family transcriptional regulator [Acidimicrobiales bacterium]HJM96698.1 LysR family transcriptional regulator [Acidimicrobiales bacterium]
MDIRQLNALVAVVDNGSFSAAAQSLHTVQSNISTHIARLEKELAVSLIDRRTGVLTEEGQLVVQRARRVQTELESIALDVEALHSEVSGIVRLGVIGTTGRWVTPILLESMIEKYPRVRIQITDAVTSNLMPLVVQGRVDGAIVNLPISHPDVELEPLFEEEPVLVAPHGHPLAIYDSLTPSILAEFPLLLNPTGVPFRDSLDRDLAKHGVKLTPKAEVDGMRLLASLATDGFGAAVLPATAAQGSGKWKRIPLEGFTRRVVGLATNKRVPLSATTRVVRDVLRNMIQDHGSDQNGIYLAN